MHRLSLTVTALALLGGCGDASSRPPAPQPNALAEAPVAPVAEATPAVRKASSSMTELPPLVRGQSRIPAALHGTWRVAAQSTVGDGVQAYADNDPALLGADLTITADRAAWASTTEPLTGACQDAFFDSEASGAELGSTREELAAPLKRVGASVEGARLVRFLCMGEASNWGPTEEQLDLLLLRDGRVAVRYFDNLLLVLEKG